MFCINCGQQINTIERFCGNCDIEAKTKEESFSIKTKNCVFCKVEIGIDNTKCPSCKRILIEKISSGRKHETGVPKFQNPTKKNIFLKYVDLIINLNYSKFIINKYVGGLLAIIFIVWIYSGNDVSYNGGGVKTPLPAPVQQFSENSEDIYPSVFSVFLTNGTVMKTRSTYLKGEGELEIKNGTNLDAVAKLIRDGFSVLTVYIKANSNYTMTNISDGTYWLAFAQGLDWDSTSQRFRQNIQFSVFEETFDFITTEDSLYYYSPGFEVTLHPVVGGSAETNSVDPAQFDAY